MTNIKKQVMASAWRFFKAENGHTFSYCLIQAWKIEKMKKAGVVKWTRVNGEVDTREVMTLDAVNYQPKGTGRPMPNTHVIFVDKSKYADPQNRKDQRFMISFKFTQA